MSVSERWARTPDQITVLHTARTSGGACSWCGRNLDDDEPVYVERFLTGEKRPTWQQGMRHRSATWAPVGVECASPELLQQTEEQMPERCASCGRGVFYRQARATVQQASCSRLCAHRVARARGSAEPSVSS